MNSFAPLSPENAKEAQLLWRKTNIPQGVIAVFNEFLCQELDDDGNAIIDQDDIVPVVAERMGVDRSVVYAKKWLDIEDIFREAGWKVEYVKLPYYDPGSHYWTFAKKR
jgi:hypothetical protein